MEKIIVEPERNVICSDMHKMKSRALLLVQRKPGVFALLLFTAEHWEERLEIPALCQVQREPFDFRLGDLFLRDAKSFLK